MMHPLLEKQLQTVARRSHDSNVDTATLLLDLISDAYRESDRVRNRLEHSMKMTSEEMRELHKETLAQKISAEEANKAKSRFLATMSHEIRTPMNGVLGFASLLANSPLNDEQQESVKIITDSGQQLLSILNDILDLSKIETNALELEETEIDIEELVNGTASRFRAQATLKGLELSFFIDPSLPITVMGDFGRLNQILNNLVGNAIKFTEEGTVGIEVTATQQTTDDNPEMAFHVKDTGIGFSADLEKHLFKEFTQADSSITRRYGGTGLGLSISKKLANLMGGSITVKSKQGEGSIFSFIIPFKAAIPPASTIYKSQNCQGLEGAKILIVDDNHINRDFFQKQVTHYGMTCQTAESVEQALFILAEAHKNNKQFDIAILDHLMPEEDGFVLARKMRADPAYRNIPLILSSSAGATSLEYAQSRGFDALAPKPIQQSQLLRLLQNFINNDNISPLSKPTSLSGATGESTTAIKQTEESNGYILIAEDNAINQKLIEATLRSAGYHFEVAVDGLKAVEMVQKHNFDMIIMDIHMPNLSGCEATMAIRAMPNDINKIPILAATANAMEGDREKYLEAGMNDYIAKPFEAADLIKHIEHFIGKPKFKVAKIADQKPEVRKQQEKLEKMSWSK